MASLSNYCLQGQSSISTSKTSSIPGYDPSMAPVSTQDLSEGVNLDLARNKQMMSLAYGPGKQLFMTAFMLWMSGSHLNIFSIMMTGMALWSPVKSMISVGTVFSKFEDLGSKVVQAKMIFIALNGVGLAMGAYKLGNMGLLPLYSSDWISLLDEQLSH